MAGRIVADASSSGSDHRPIICPLVFSIMNDTGESVRNCDRCGERMGAVAAQVAIQSGPLSASHPSLELCAGCSDSLERWLARRGRGRHSHSHSHSHSQHRGGLDEPAMFATPAAGQQVLWAEGERGRQIVIALVLISAFAVGLFLVMSMLG